MTRARGVGAALLCVAAATACGDDPAPPPMPSAPSLAYEPVVETAIAELSMQLPQIAEAPEADPELVRELTEVLVGSADDPRMRELPLEEIAGIGDAALPELERIARDEAAEASRRAAAIELMRAVGTTAAGMRLVDLCDSRNASWIRSHAAWRLSELSPEVDVVVPGLLLRLRSETDHEAAVYVAAALAARRNYAGATMLWTLADSDADEGVRERALGQLNAIVAMSGAPDAATLIARWEGREPGLEGHEPSDALRLSTWRWIETLSGDTFQLRPVDDARFLLSRLGPWAVEPLARALGDEDPYIRLHAAQCLERMGARARPALPRLIEALDDPRLGAQAARAIGAIGGTDALANLQRVAEAGPHEIRVAGARALGALGDPAANALLHDLLADEAAPVDLRQAAADSLLLLDPDDERAPRFLTACLTDPAADVGGSEHALEAWLRSRAESDDDPRLQAWVAAGRNAAGPIPTSSESTARRAARATIMRERVLAQER